MTVAGRVRIAVAALAVAAAAGGCAATVDGHGSVAAPNDRSSGPRPTGFPSLSSTPVGPSTPVVPSNSISGPTGRPGSSAPTGSPSSPVVPSNSISTSAPPSGPSSSGSSRPTSSDLTCPTIVDTGVHLKWTCIVPRMTGHKGQVWPNDFADVIEPKTGWAITSGDGHWGSRDGHTLKAICLDVRRQMLTARSYGTDPTVHTLDASKANINGAKGYLVESGFRLSTAYRKKSGTAVTYEKSWIVAVQIGGDDYSLWYVSIPDVAKRLWSRVHDDIASIHVIN